jgi:hypothetical protein
MMTVEKAEKLRLRRSEDEERGRGQDIGVLAAGRASFGKSLSIFFTFSLDASERIEPSS